MRQGRPCCFCDVDFSGFGEDDGVGAICDVWRTSRPEKTGYTYDGRANFGAAIGPLSRPGRVLFNPDRTDMVHDARVVGAGIGRRAKAILRGGIDMLPMRAIDHYAVHADLGFQTDHVCDSGRIVVWSEFVEDVGAPGDIPRADAVALFRSNFATLGVTERDIRHALAALEKRVPYHATPQSVFAMFHNVIPGRAAGSRRTVCRTLKNALRKLKQPLKGDKSQLVERISNLFTIRPDPSHGEPGEWPSPDSPSSTRPGRLIDCLGDSIAAGHRPPAAALAPAIHDPKRIATYGCEYSGNFINILPDDLDDYYIGGEKDVQAECEAPLRYKIHINDGGRMHPGYSTPPLESHPYRRRP